MANYPLIHIRGQVLGVSTQPRGYAFGAIYHQAMMTHIESNGVIFIINTGGLILSRKGSKGGVTLSMTRFHESFHTLLDRRAKEDWTSYYILGKPEIGTIKTPRRISFHDVLRNIRKEAKNL